MMTKQTMTSRLLLMIAVLAIGPVASGQSLKAVPRPAARVQRQSTVRFQNRQTAARLVRAQEPDLQMREESSLPAPSAADLERRRAEKQQRFMQIIDRLKNLQNQMQQAKEDRAAQQEIQDPSDTEQLSVSTGSEATMVDLKDPVDSDSKPPEPEAPTESDVPNSTLPDLPATDSGVVAGSSNVEGIDLSFEVLVDGPVNRVAAADNLYRIKEYKLALEMYAQVDVRQLSDDQQFWVQFRLQSLLTFDEVTFQSGDPLQTVLQQTFLPRQFFLQVR